MQLEIRRQDAHLDEAMREFVERRINFALGAFEDKVARVSVNLDDVNGPRGGVDKQCRILISMRRGTPVMVEDLDVDLASAVGRAADRAGNAVSRRIERRRQRKGG
jgi:ribosome hibernation promoting factor